MSNEVWYFMKMVYGGGPTIIPVIGVNNLERKISPILKHSVDTMLPQIHEKVKKYK